MSDQTELPPIPGSVYSALGPVPVVLVDDLRDEEDRALLGRWCPEERCIKLCAGVHPKTMLVTLYHERLHQICWDAGVGIGRKREERICDAISSALVAELLASVTACS